MELGNIVYKNNGFIITEYPGVRQYDVSEIDRRDRIYRFQLNTKENQPTIEDVAMLVFFILKNKILENPFQEYKEKILDAINKAEYERFYPENLEEP